MTLGAGAFAYLTTAVPTAGVFPMSLPQNADLPAIVFQLIPSVGPLHTHEDAHAGSGPARGIFRRDRLQLSCWADTYDAAAELGRTVALAVDGYAGAWGTVQIGSSLVDGEQDDWDPKTRKYRRIVDVLVQWQDPADGS